MMLVILYVLFFFFKQKTAYEMRISDWSSDVCSSDLSSGGSLPNAASPPSASRLISRSTRASARLSGLDASNARDRKSVVEGKSVSVRVDFGGRRIIKKKN